MDFHWVSAWLAAGKCLQLGRKQQKMSQHWDSDNEETTLQFVAEPRILEAHLVVFEVQTSTTPPPLPSSPWEQPQPFMSPPAQKVSWIPRAKPPLDTRTDETAEQDQTQTIPQAPPRLLQLPDNPSD